MAGCRSLNAQEVDLIIKNLETSRNKCLFILGLRTGLRISELLSITVGQVYADNAVQSRLKVPKRFTKGKVRTVEVALHKQAVDAIRTLIEDLIGDYGYSGLDSNLYLFQAYKGKNQKLSRFMAHNVLKKAYKLSGLTGCLATHSMRKSFAAHVWSASGKDLLMTQRALNHKSILSTVNYLETSSDELDKLVLGA